jgi:hypothetical protein
MEVDKYITVEITKVEEISVNLINTQCIAVDIVDNELITVDYKLIDVLRNLYLQNLLDVSMANIVEDQVIVRESGKWTNKDRAPKAENLDDEQGNLSSAKEVKDAIDFLEGTSGLFESDENDDLMPVLTRANADFEEDNNNDLMPTELAFEYIDEDFELDENGDIIPRE